MPAQPEEEALTPGEDSALDQTSEPQEFPGTFRQRIDATQSRLEAEYRGKASDDTDKDEIKERAELDAQYAEAHNWLVAKWGERYPCPVCRNVKWTVSPVFPAYNGFLSFQVTCRSCGNSMSVIPGHADLEAPTLAEEQLQLHEGE